MSFPFRSKVHVKFFINLCAYIKSNCVVGLVRNLHFQNKINNFHQEHNFRCYRNTLHNYLFSSVKCRGLSEVQVAFLNTKAQTKLCWNCDKVVHAASLFCESCNTLQPVDKDADFFEIIGISRSYRTESSNLRRKYRKLQTLLHPDKFSAKPKKEQELSDEFSSIVNKAYATLLDPLERGLYMLRLHNVSIVEGSTDVDKTFLMDILERNEEIENESDPQKLKEYFDKNKDQLEFYIGKVTEAFDSNDIELAKTLLTKMKYYKSIDTKIREIKQKLNIPD